MSALTIENYSKGFLIDDELMAGITSNPENPGTYVAFVLQHTTGEYLGYQPFSDLPTALQSLNQIPRSWAFEQAGGCGGGCKEGGSCSKGSCGTQKCNKGACSVLTPKT